MLLVARQALPSPGFAQAPGHLRQALGSRIGEAYHAWKKAVFDNAANDAPHRSGR